MLARQVFYYYYNPKEFKVGPQSGICSLMFIETIFTVAKKQKQSKSPSVGEWINIMWSVHTVEYYLALQRKKF
jgi:hypothetical protein